MIRMLPLHRRISLRLLFQTFSIPLLMFIGLLVSAGKIPGNLRWAMLYGVIIIGLIISRRNKFPNKFMPHGMLLVTAFLFSIVFSGVINLPDWYPLARALSYVSCVWAVIIVLQLSNKRITCDNLLNGFEVFGIILILLSLISFPNAKVEHGRYCLLGLNPNWAGASLGFSTLVIGLRCLLDSSSKLKLCRCILVILGSMLIFKTGSRTPILAGMISLFVVFPIVFKPIRSKLVYALVVFVVAVIFFNAFRAGIYSFLLRGQTIGESTTGRLPSLKEASWGQFAEHIWFGIGLGNEMKVPVIEIGFVGLLTRIGVTGAISFCLLAMLSLKEWLVYIIYMSKRRCCYVSIIIMFSAYCYLLSLSITENYIIGIGNWATVPLFMLCICGFTVDDPK